MNASYYLKKQIVLEILILTLLSSVSLYAIYAMKGTNNKISSKDGIVTVLDDSKYKALDILSDGEGLDTEGITYTITNNNSVDKTIKVLLSSNKLTEELSKNIKISINDLYIETLSDLEKIDNNYVIATSILMPGHTKNYLIKVWYDKETKEKIEKKLDLKFNIITQ